MISILVSTCDSYHDVLDLFFNSFNEYWPNCKYNIIINGERRLYNNKKINLKIENHLTNEHKWGARLLKSLRSIQNEYVINLLDDYLLDSTFDILKLNNAISILQNDKDASCVYLYHLSDLEMTKSDNENFCIVSNNSLYKINTLPSIWKRTELIKIHNLNFAILKPFNKKLNFHNNDLFESSSLFKNSLFVKSLGKLYLFILS